MLFAIMCSDRPGGLETRKANRPAHLEFLDGLGDGLAFAGPFTDANGDPNGSLVVIEAPDMASAEAIADSDPYAKAGLFASRDIRPWKWLIKAPEGR